VVARVVAPGWWADSPGTNGTNRFAVHNSEAVGPAVVEVDREGDVAVVVEEVAVVVVAVGEVVREAGTFAKALPGPGYPGMRRRMGTPRISTKV
jgi:hypothetical protein